MKPDEFQEGDVALFKRDVEVDGAVFPSGTECVVLGSTTGGACRVEVLEPRREVISVPEDAPEPVQP